MCAVTKPDMWPFGFKLHMFNLTHPGKPYIIGRNCIEILRGVYCD
jgi:hypothetical protein